MANPYPNINRDSDINGDGNIGLAKAIYSLQIIAGIRTPNNIHASKIITPDDGGEISLLDFATVDFLSNTFIDNQIVELSITTDNGTGELFERTACHHRRKMIPKSPDKMIPF